MLLLLVPSLADVTRSHDVGIPELCACGCGKIKGECCCAAPRTSRLELGCSNGEDPNSPLDGSSTGKIVAAAGGVGLALPVESDAELTDPSPAFSDRDPLPEVPPPRT